MRSRWNPCGVQLPFRERWPRRSGAVVGLLVLTLCAPAATETANGAARASPVLKLHQVVEQLVEDGAPGAIVVVRTPSGVRRAAAGLARIRPRLTMAPSDRFRIASITKTFVATVALQLAAEGRLRLADPVDRWVPGLVPEGRSITLRELLDHTSGLYDYTADREWTAQRIAHPGRTWTPRELVRVAARHKLLFRPGTDWHYSNTNYVLLGLVVEAAARASLGDELRERIFRPLRLVATSFPPGSSIPGRVAHGYLGSLPGLPIPPGQLLDVTSLVSPSSWGAGQIVSTADDVTAFLAALLGGRVLQPAQLAAMKSRVTTMRREQGIIVQRTADYGLGLEIHQSPCGTTYGHDGDTPGWRTVAWATGDGRRVVDVMVNVLSPRVTWPLIRAAATQAFCSA
jgi:D-alanyl-D-alanine carboxypeptidase